jgi:transcriptional regulator with XRE-family HTH domain
MGWTRRTAAVTLLHVTELQQREMGERVARLRDAAGMTNESLARKAGLSTKTVSRFVNGKHEARVATIEALAKALRVPEREIRGAPPSPFAEGKRASDTAEDRLAQLEQRVTKQLADHARKVEELLRRQSRILQRIEQAIAIEEKTATRLAVDGEAWADALIARVQAELRDEPPTPAPKRKAPAKSQTPQA